MSEKTVKCPLQRVEVSVSWCDDNQYHDRCRAANCSLDKGREISKYQERKRHEGKKH